MTDPADEVTRVNAELEAAANQTAIETIREVIADANAMNPEDYKTGQDHLSPAFREVNFRDAFLATTQLLERIERALP